MTSEDLANPLWRLRNLYSCREEGTGRKLRLTLRPEQEAIFQHFISKPDVPAYIIKSRRQGISTGICTYQADQAVFRSRFRGLLVDLTQADATKKMVEIIRFGVDSLDPLILRDYVSDKRNDSELRIRYKGETEAQDSVIYATTGGRGGDCSMLHVSEWGKIAATDPKRSNEIRTGAFPAARKAVRVVETTWYGGKSGDLWQMVKPIMEKDPNAEGQIFFFPWHSDPQAVRFDGGFVGQDLEKYFIELAEKVGRTFRQEQKLWFAAKKVEQGIFIKREYPSTLDEAFSAPVEGSIYGPVIAELRTAGKIIPFEWDRSCPLYASWDIGWSDKTTIWVFQIIGRDIHWIFHCKRSQHNAAQMLRILADAGLPVSMHYLPHDAAKTDPGGGLSYIGHMEKAGVNGIVRVPRCVSIWDGINATRDLLQRSWFRLPECADGLADLEAYHTLAVTSSGAVTHEPVHDESSHTADGMRTAGEAIELGLVNNAKAKRLISAPKYPDGSLVSMSAVQLERERARGGGGRATAISGGFRL